ncbi:GNAT family N-acetyltransferase [Bacillus sp. AK031]
MQGYQFIKDYRDNGKFRSSFNELAAQTFGISFEEWYEKGFWTDKYQPYSLLDGDKVIANVSVSKIDLLVHGQRKRAIQIGTVMTHPEYRKKGLSALLMEKVLHDYQQVDLFYLFANNTVLDFYPKFGFLPVQEYQGIMKVTPQGSKAGLAKLDAGSLGDRKLIRRLAENRVPVSQKFSTVDTAELFMFYCLYVFPQDIYYLQQEGIIILMKMEGVELHVFDIVSPKAVDVEKLMAQIAPEGTKKVFFHFTNDSNGEGSKTKLFHGDEVLFVKPAKGLELPSEFKHPITSQA